jgi:putative acetyltransferase
MSLPLVEIHLGDPRTSDVASMIRDSDAYYAALYPAESNHLLDVDELKRPEVSFLVVMRERQVCGFGSVVDMGGYGELKRMYVEPACRGFGFGRRLLACLEHRAIELRLPIMRLETGIRQPEAISLYRTHGYREIAAYGSYRPDPLSLFMEKGLEKRSAFSSEHPAPGVVDASPAP